MSNCDKPSPAPNAWSELRESVHRYVARRVRDPHAAEDVAQDVMLKVQAKLPSLPPAERLGAWVFAIARNAVIDHYRARRDVLPVEQAAAVAIAEEEEDPANELSACVRRMIDHLPEPYAEALRLADLDGVSQQELAEHVGISLSGAKSRVQRAREKLHAMILDCCELEQNHRGQVVDYRTTPRSQRYCGPAEAENGGSPRGGCV